MEPAENNVGNSLRIVSTVYVAVLLPWAFLYLHDFISDRWRTIRRTAFNGFLHLLVVLLPLPYLVYYIILQARLTDPDYKELFAAVTASVFSIYHFLRTLWGLYQLHRFRQWARAVARAFASASYPCILFPSSHRRPTPPPPSHRKPPVWRSLLQLGNSSSVFSTPTRHHPPSKPVPSPPTPLPVRSLDLHATDPAALEAGLHHHVSARVCSTHDLNPPAASPANPSALPHHSTHGSKNDPSSLEREAHICWSIDRMLVNSSIIDNEFINSYSPFKLAASSWRLQPVRRKGTFVRWAVLYLAHFGRQWFADCQTKGFSKATWEGRRSNLAAKVWATAVLRMETECQAAVVNSSSQSAVQGNSGATSFLDPCDWNRVTPALDEQLFEKEYVLKECFLSGEGLPYNYPLIDDRDQPLPSHGLYRPLLKEATGSLPTRHFDEVENMTTDYIEWFAVFLWVRRWGGCMPEETHSPSGTSEDTSTVVLKNKRTPALAPTDTPVRVLQDQLGLSCPPTLDRCAFPFINLGYGRQLWQNRSILQVSARIDNWIALCVGRQTVFLLDNDSDLAPGGKTFERAHSIHSSSHSTASTKNDTESDHALHSEPGDMPADLNGQDPDVSKDPGKGSSATDCDEATGHARSSAIIAFHKLLEIKRLRYQLADSFPQHNHLEHCLTFMGCVMESVRSGIAETLTSKENISVWTPPIPNEAVSFAISEQLRRCFGSVFFAESSASSPFDSTVRERILWETQNGVRYQWQNKMVHDRFQGRPSAAPATVEAMMLCVLGFPSIYIANRNSNQDSGKMPPVLNFQLLPVAGPQHLRIDLQVDCATSMMTAKLLACDSELSNNTIHALFKWQDWRDAFEGRLIGKAEWQKTHSMRQLPVRRTNACISKGIQRMVIGEDDGDRPVPLFRRYLVWEGWKPFRAGMTLFELRHSSLIILGDSMPTDAYSPTLTHADSTSTEADEARYNSDSGQVVVNAYRRAKTAALADASIHLDALLTLDKNLLADTDAVGQEDGEEGVESQLVDFAPASSASSSSDGHSFRMEFNFNPPHPNVIKARAKKQSPLAMHVLAKWVLTGTKGFQKNYDKALLLMERALVLGRNIKTARLLVKSLIDKTFMPDIPMDIDRALAAVELLWRDMAGRHEVVSVGNKKVRRWKGDTDAELARMSKLVKLHLKLVAMRPTAEMMRNLADRLSTWGESQVDEETATVLYETAILANCDSKSIMELGRRFHRRDPQFAAAMYQRALIVGQESAARHLSDLLVEGECDLKMSPAEIAAVYEKAARLGHVGAMRELGLLLLRGDHGVVSDIIRGKMLADRAAYGDSIARALEHGVSSLDIDNRQAEELRIAAERAYGINPSTQFSVGGADKDIHGPL